MNFAIQTAVAFDVDEAKFIRIAKAGQTVTVSEWQGAELAPIRLRWIR